MICVGIDVAKDKHDCFILNSEGVVLADAFTIPNNLEGFQTLLHKLRACSTPQDSIKVGLEATGHYSCNILGFLLDNGLATIASRFHLALPVGEGIPCCSSPAAIFPRLSPAIYCSNIQRTTLASLRFTVNSPLGPTSYP